jgi:Uma2 family endonuclease
MNAMTVAQRMTADEYLAWDGPRGTNLVEGEVVMPQSRQLHQNVLADLYMALRLWRDAGKGRGHVTLPIDVSLDDVNVYAPDVLWYRSERALGHDDDPPYSLPDIAVEIRSPSTWPTTSAPRRPPTSATACRSCGWSTRRRARSWSSGARHRRRRCTT